MGNEHQRDNFPLCRKKMTWLYKNKLRHHDNKWSVGKTCCQMYCTFMLSEHSCIILHFPASAPTLYGILYSNRHSYATQTTLEWWIYRNGGCLGAEVKVGEVGVCVDTRVCTCECLCALEDVFNPNTCFFLMGEICLRHHCMLWGLKCLSYHTGSPLVLE